MVKEFIFKFPGFYKEPEFTFTAQFVLEDELSKEAEDKALYIVYRTVMDHLDEVILKELSPKHQSKSDWIALYAQEVADNTD